MLPLCGEPLLAPGDSMNQACGPCPEIQADMGSNFALYCVLMCFLMEHGHIVELSSWCIWVGFLEEM